jgi:scyllo-inositol 2-dehydrogenase (NADP+)
MINVGLIGFGLSGRYLQAPFFQSNEHFFLKNVVTSKPIPTQFFPNTKRVDYYKTLLEDNDIQLISICSPSSTHYTYAKESLLAGKSVLIEKPITATLAEATELFELAKTKGLHVFVYQNRRFDSDFLTLKAVLKSGILGEIHTYEANFDRYKPLLNPKKWKEAPSPANGILYDLGSHLIDQVISLFGYPSAVSGEVFAQRKDSQIDDAFHLDIIYPTLKVRLNSSLLMKIPRPRFSIHGSEGSFVKNGIDVQEEHLVADYWPSLPSFGVENNQFKANVSYKSNGIDFSGQIESEKGNWSMLFENIADVMLNNAMPFFDPKEILCQLEIINGIKSISKA